MPRLRADKSREAYRTWARDDPQAIAVDTETSGFSWYAEAFCATIAWEGESHYLNLDDVSSRSRAKAMLKDTPKLVFHNAKFDLQKLIYAGVMSRQDLSPERIEDTDCLAHLINPHGNKKLKHLAKVVLGLETDEASAIQKAKAALQKHYKRETGRTLYAADIGYHMLPKRVVYPYAIKDAEYTWELWKRLKPAIKGELLDLYDREMELTLVLLDIEANGMKVDIPYVEREIKVKNGQILSCELRIADLTGLKVWYPERPSQKTPEGAFNPNSGAQILAWFANSGISIPDTRKATLSQVDHELARTIDDLRGYKKLLVTYLLNMKNDQRNGIIHPGYKQHEVKTGRMSSGTGSAD